MDVLNNTSAAEPGHFQYTIGTLTGRESNNNLVFIVLAFATLTLGYSLATGKSKKQRLVPGVPIVGGTDKESILQSRIRFIHDGKNMLQEGYSQVYLSGIKWERSRTNSFVVEEQLLLHPQCARRETDDSDQVP